MTILDRVRLFLRTKHEHVYRPEQGRMVCACGVVDPRVVDRETGIAIRFLRKFDITPDPKPFRWALCRCGQELLGQSAMNKHRCPPALTALDFHAGAQH